MRDAIRAKHYLEKFFKEIGIEIQTNSRKEIEETFKLAKGYRD